MNVVTTFETPLQRIKGICDALEKFQYQIELALHRDGDTHSFNDIACGVFSGAYEIAYNDTAIGIAEIMNFPNERVYSVFIAAGDLQGALDLLPIAEHNGRQHGCATLAFVGRLGWRKMLTKRGWSSHMIRMSRPITQLGTE